jgi:poly(3-hydroxybutyrate) depolymerase
MANGDLRAYTDPEKMGYIKKNLVVDGWRREWYEYVPASVKAMGPNAAVPLVVAMHGRSGVGREYVGRSGWDKVAEDRGFIVVYPSSSVTLINKTAVPNTVWNINKDPKGVDDVKYIRMMIENIKTNHKIDSGRIYSSGQSMGGMMSYANLLFLSDVFTAVGCTSGFIPDGPEFYKHPDINTRFEVPYWVMMGDKDAYLGGESSPLRNKMVKAQIEYLINRYGTTALDQAGTYKSGPYNHRVWYNKTGVPMIRYTVIDNMPHATLPETCLIMWDDFLRKFYRDSDGKIVYEKGKINKY